MRGAQGGDTTKRGAVFRQTFETIWNKEAIDSLHEDLEEVRQALQLRAAILVKKKLEDYSMTLEDSIKLLDERTASLLSLSPILGDLRTQTDTIIRNQLQGEISAQARHDEILTRLSTVQPLPPTSMSQLNPEDALRYDLIAKETILASLWFPDMTEREATIQAAYQRTFEWAFCDPEQENKPWDNLSNLSSEGWGTVLCLGKTWVGEVHADEVHRRRFTHRGDAEGVVWRPPMLRGPTLFHPEDRTSRSPRQA